MVAFLRFLTACWPSGGGGEFNENDDMEDSIASPELGKEWHKFVRCAHAQHLVWAQHAMSVYGNSALGMTSFL